MIADVPGIAKTGLTIISLRELAELKRLRKLARKMEALLSKEASRKAGKQSP